MKRDENDLCYAVQENHRGSDEAGAILVLLAIMLVTLISFLALSIDTGRIAASSSKQYSTANLATLAALEAYSATPYDTNISPDPTATESLNHRARLIAAFDRAEEVIALERNKLEQQNGVDQLSSGHLADGSGFLTDRSDDSAGVLTPGKYFQEEPEGLCATYIANGGSNVGCPCNGGVWNGACFRANGPGDLTASAFDLQLKSVDDAPLGNAFGRIIGQERFDITSRSRSAVLPNIGIYALDLSPSTTFKTHLAYETLGNTQAEKAKASYYVFQLSGTGTSVCTSTANPCIDDTSNCEFTGPDDVSGAIGDLSRFLWYGVDPTTQADPSQWAFNAAAPWDDWRYPGMEKLPGTGRPANDPIWKHYRDDYTCHTVDINGDSIDEHYLVNTARGYDVDSTGDGFADTQYRGPEPLYTILDALHEGLDLLKDRAIAGDQIALMGFDRWVFDKQAGNYASDANLGRVIGPTFPGLPSFTALGEITDTAQANDVKRINAGFIALPGAKTDIARAVIESHRIFRHLDTSRNANRFVALISDGMNTCVHWWGGSHWRDFIFKDPSDEFQLYDGPCNPPIGPPGLAPDDGYNYPNTVSQHVGGLNEASTMVAGFTPDSYKAFVDGGDASATPGQPGYADSWGYYYYMQDVGMPTFVQLNITFHSVIYGGQPSTILRKNWYSGGCLTDEDARKHQEPFVPPNSTEWAGTPPDDNQLCYWRVFSDDPCPYYYYLDFFHVMSRMTGGYFVPIRKPCDMAAVAASGTTYKIDTVSGETCDDFQDQLDKLCEDASGNNSSLMWDDGLASAGVIDRVKNNYHSRYDGTRYEPLFTKPVYDSIHTRLTCDPGCRSESEQFRSLIDKIYSVKPYNLVDETT